MHLMQTHMAIRCAAGALAHAGQPLALARNGRDAGGRAEPPTVEREGGHLSRRRSMR
jgi:hypothetical protein